jgi:long-chain acyl-CoA synthetase
MAIDDARPDTFPKLLLEHARKRGERPAMREKNRGIWKTTTWRALADEVAALAAALSERGLKRGAHVALVGDNRPRLYSAMAATHWLGAIATPLFADGTAEELVAAIQSTEATHVFAENQEQVDKLLEILPRCPAVRCIVYDQDRGMRHYRQPQLVSYADLLQQGRDLLAGRRDAVLAEAARGSGADPAFLFFTSGTTGPAKGVVLSHASVIDRARVAAAAEGLNDHDVAMAYLPPGWIGQCLFGYAQPMVVGYCVCCPESSETLLADMREMGPTCFLATPRVLQSLLAQVTMRLEDSGGFNQALYRYYMAAAQRAGARRLAGQPATLGDRLGSLLGNVLIYGPLRDVLGMSRVRVAYSAGDAIAADVLLFFRALGINLKQLYGSTETGFFVAMQRNGVVRPDTVGAAADGVELSFTAEREILVRSPGLFVEYHRDPDRTARARNAEGWFHTGDLGYLGEDGQLRIIDRLPNLGALSDGTPYAPRPIENRLKSDLHIREAVAFGDKRDMVCVLVDIDAATVGRWADKQAISYTGRADLASREEVQGLIADCIARANGALASEPALAKGQIRRFALLPGELSAADGLLTRTGKLRRGAIAERYRTLIDALYDGRTEAPVEAGSDDGGHAGAAPLDIKIRDVGATAPAQARRAM